jgi:autotransporter-associated beta strand protein
MHTRSNSPRVLAGSIATLLVATVLTATAPLAHADIIANPTTFNYLDPAIYTGGFVDGDITRALGANTTFTMAGDFTTPLVDTGGTNLSPDLVFTYSGAFNVTISGTGGGANKNLILNGNILLDAQDAGARTVTIGATGAGNAVIVGLGDANRTVTVASGDILVFFNSVDITSPSANSLTKEGAGIVQFNGGSGSYTGGYIQNAGVTRLAASSNTSASNLTGPLGTGTVTLNAGRLQSNDGTTRTLENAILINQTGTLNFGATGTAATNGTIVFSAADGNGTTLGGPAGQRTLTVDSALTINQVISQAVADVGLDKAGLGSLTLGAANTYAGGTTVSAGTILVAPAGNLGADSATNNITVNGPGRLILGAATNVGAAQTVTVASTGTALAVVGASYNAVPTFNTATAGVFAINSATFDAITDLDAALPDNWFLGSTAAGTFTGTSLAPGNGNVYRLGGGAGGVGGGGTGSGAGGGGATLTFPTANVLTGTATVEIGSTLLNGGGAVTLTAVQDYTGGTTIQGPVVPVGGTSTTNQGVLGINVAGAIAASQITINSGGVLALRVDDALTAANALDINPGGRLLVSSALGQAPNAINQNVTIKGGASLEVTPTNGLTGTGTITLDPGAIVRITQPNALAGSQLTPAMITAGRILSIAADNPTGLASIGDGAIIEIAVDGNRSLTGTATTPVDIDLNNKVLTNSTSNVNVNNVGGDSTTSVANITATTALTIAATTGTTFTIVEDVVAPGATLTVGSLTPIAGLDKAGIVNIPGGNSTTADDDGHFNVGSTGTIDIVAGTLQQSAGGSAALTTGTLNVAAGATFTRTTAFASTVGIITGAGTVNTTTGTTNINGSLSGTFTGVLSGGGLFSKTGSGTQTLGGSVANTNTGVVTVSGGILALAKTAGTNALGASGTLVINTGGTVRLDVSDQIPDAKALTLGGGTLLRGIGASEGSISSDGAATLTLTANSTLDFGAHGSDVGVLSFDNFAPAGFTLSILNWTGLANQIGDSTTDRLIFDASQAANLAQFSFDGFTPGAAQFDLGNGYFEIVPVPEPGAVLSLLGGFGTLLGLRRFRRC